jgi:hypothetical protein
LFEVQKPFEVTAPERQPHRCSLAKWKGRIEALGWMHSWIHVSRLFRPV